MQVAVAYFAANRQRYIRLHNSTSHFQRQESHYIRLFKECEFI